MKKFFVSLLLPLLLFACTKGPKNDIPDDGTYMAKITLAGDYLDISTSTLISKAGLHNTYYSFEIDSMRVNNRDTTYYYYAEGLFDDVTNLSVSLESGHQYRIRCHIFESREDDLEPDSDGYFYAPFSDRHKQGTGEDGVKMNNAWTYNAVNNRMIYTSENGWLDLDVKDGEYKCNVKMDHYFGIAYTSGDIVLRMKRRSVGLHFLLAPPKEGKLVVWNNYPSFRYTLSPSSTMVDEEYIYTERQLDSEVAMQLNLRIMWTRDNGESMDLSPKNEIILAPKTMTTIKVDINSRIDESGIVISKSDSELSQNPDVVIN